MYRLINGTAKINHHEIIRYQEVILWYRYMYQDINLPKMEISDNVGGTSPFSR